MAKHYTKEFKQEAVNLVVKQGYSESEAATRLGVNNKNIYRWVQENRNNEPVKEESLQGAQAEIIRLRKENERLKMEKEILKKAAAFFANEKN
jgi:transposase